MIWSIGLIVEVQACHCFLGHSPLYLRAFVPLVKGSNGDDFWSRSQSGLQGRLVVPSIHPVSGVVVVPWAYGCVHVAWADAGNEQQVVGVTEGFDGFPVLMGGTEREAVGGKVCVNAIKAASLDVMFVTLLHDECHENTVVRCPSDAVGAFRRQQLCPGLWWCQVGVIDVKQRQDPPCGGPESVEGAVFSIPEGKTGGFQSVKTC